MSVLTIKPPCAPVLRSPATAWPCRQLSVIQGVPPRTNHWRPPSPLRNHYLNESQSVHLATFIRANLCRRAGGYTIWVVWGEESGPEGRKASVGTCILCAISLDHPNPNSTMMSNFLRRHRFDSAICSVFTHSFISRLIHPNEASISDFQGNIISEQRYLIPLAGLTSAWSLLHLELYRHLHMDSEGKEVVVRPLATRSCCRR